MSADLVPVPVPGADDLMAAQFDGREWAALKPMCDTLGIDYSAQLKRLKGRSWAGMAVMAIPSPGGVQQTTVIDSATIPLWLATIDERRVNEDARAKLIAYQREARDALHAYFNQRIAAAPAMNQLDVLRAALDQIEAAQRDAAEARQLAARTDARLDAIEGKHDWFSALGFARQAGITNTSTPAMNRLGRQAAAIAKANGITPEKVPHHLYGTANLLPLWIWELAAEGRRELDS